MKPSLGGAQKPVSTEDGVENVDDRKVGRVRLAGDELLPRADRDCVDMSDSLPDDLIERNRCPQS